MTDHTGLVLERWDHYPFGEEWVSGPTGDRYRYTGHPRDQETGHDYAGELDLWSLQELIILHELGHATGFLFVDTGDPRKAAENNRKVWEACFQ